MNNKMMVSVCCITYNQAEYIKDALDSFLMQKTNFKYEVIIHDDASTDGTTEIIKEYADKYPEIIKPIFEKENQYSKGVKRILNFTFKVAKGKYIALCEGDDYWSSENKLQLQVDYMEKNPNCTLLFHNAKIIDMIDGKETNFVPYTKRIGRHLKIDGNYNVGELELLEFIPTASFMFRTYNLKKMPKFYEECFVGDWPLKLIMTSFGYAHYIDEVMSIYRKNANGSMTVRNEKKEKENVEGKLDILNKKETFVNQMDKFTNYKYHSVFEQRLLQYKIERLLCTSKKNNIIIILYTKIISLIKKIKYILKIYFPKFIKKLKGIK